MNLKFWSSVALLSCLFSLQTGHSNAQDGALDLSFNSTGKVTSTLGTFDDDIYAIAIQPDGKIVVAGHSYQGGHYVFAVARYNSSGSLDPTFDTDGLVTTIFDAADAKGKAVALQSDGKIVVAGMSSDGTTERFAIARYNSDGTLDNTFDLDGKTTTVVGTGWSAAHSIALQSDGKIVAAGYCTNGANQDFALVRYDAYGNLDNTFNSDGIVTTDVATKTDVAFGIKMQTDGKIIVSGYAQNVSDYDFALLRYLDNGDLDNTFDSDGKVLTKIVGSFHEYGNCLDLQADGKIVVAGGTNSTFHDFALARYMPNGSLDNTFDGDGITHVDYGTGADKGEVLAISLLSDGKIVVAGHIAYGSSMNFAVLKFKPNGSADSSFDSDGLVTTSWNNNEGARAVAVQSDGKIIAAGATHDGKQNNFALARYKNSLLSGSIVERSSNNTISLGIYPNPSNKNCVLWSATPLQNARITCHNLLGQAVWSKDGLSGDQIPLYYPQLSSGQYTLKVTHEGDLLGQVRMIIE